MQKILLMIMVSVSFTIAVVLVKIIVPNLNVVMKLQAAKNAEGKKSINEYML